jgi:Transposase domain (DUF772)
VYEAQGERHPQSRSRGRMQTPAEVALRLLLLKHIRNWSYDVLEREVRANLVYRAFTRIGDEKVPDAKTLARLGQVIGPKVIEQLHQRVVELAQERGVTEPVPSPRCSIFTVVFIINSVHFLTYQYDYHTYIFRQQGTLCLFSCVYMTYFRSPPIRGMISFP